jgi:sugar phosphate isomerase/epimerase
MQIGLVTATFRALDRGAIVALAQRGRINAIDWSGDVHVPPDQPAAAAEARRMCDDAGLAIGIYGSYYAFGDGPAGFSAVLDAALALGAPAVRVWAGRAGAGRMDAATRGRVIDDARAAVARAAAAGARVLTEWHGNSLTESLASGRQFFADVGDSRLGTLWQPTLGSELGDRLTEIRALQGRLAAVHVFSWDLPGITRLPLEAHADRWPACLAAAKAAGARQASLEFVRDDDPEQFLRDAAALRHWLEAFDREPLDPPAKSPVMG